MRKRWVAGILAGVGLTGFYLFNASWLAAAPEGRPNVLAHRGVHQTFDRTNLGENDCTAIRMRPPTNPFIENTIASMRASFDLEAVMDLVACVIHPVLDEHFSQAVSV